MQDEYSEMQYRNMYRKLRSPEGQRLSSRAFVRHIHSSLSNAMWDKYDKKPSVLTRRMKNELRRAMSLPLLPPTIAEVLGDSALDVNIIVLDGTDGPLNQIVIGNQLDKRWSNLVEVPLTNDERREQLGVRWWDTIEARLANLEEALNLREKI